MTVAGRFPSPYFTQRITRSATVAVIAQGGDVEPLSLGDLNWVQLDLGKDDHDHFIDPEERLRVAMSRQ